MRRDKPPTEDEMKRNIHKLTVLEAKRAINSKPQVYQQKDGEFPKFPEYEQMPGTKYK